MEATAARATCGLEQVRTISRTIIRGVPSRLAVLDLIPSEFVLNMSLLEKFFSSRESQRLDSAMSTICHILTLHCSMKSWTFVFFS
jgi:hypothetical protein